MYITYTCTWISEYVNIDMPDIHDIFVSLSFLFIYWNVCSGAVVYLTMNCLFFSFLFLSCLFFFGVPNFLNFSKKFLLILPKREDLKLLSLITSIRFIVFVTLTSTKTHLGSRKTTTKPLLEIVWSTLYVIYIRFFFLNLHQ